MSTNTPQALRFDLPPDTRIGIVAARFNGDLVGELLNGCRARLLELGVAADRIVEARVPGAFELPVAAKAMLKTPGIAGVICLGCVIRGDTPHFDYVAGEAARGIQLVAIEAVRPVIFGVLTTNTSEQAWARVDPNSPHGHAGEHAASAVVEMISLFDRLAARKG